MKKLLTCIIGLIVCSGCGLILSGTTQQVSFESNPSKADVYVNDVKTCTTPCVATLERNKVTPIIQIKKDGYENAQVPMMRKFNIMVAFDVFWSYCSTTAFAIDLANNTNVEYAPDRFFTVLEPIKKGEITDDNIKGKSKKILFFIAVNHSQLIYDISRGSGEYLSALFELISVQKDEQSDAFSKLKSLHVKYPDTVEFARAVVIYDFLKSQKTKN
ncbi:MAG: PEGA domain-containing protein [Nitrospirae bacterium]|nr:PEGA domain-containing protein [Nitrospirota bacterium]